MSGIVDISKLKSKGQAGLSTGSAPAPGQAAANEKKGAGSSLWWQAGLARVEKLPALHCSEASFSMLMDSISA